MEEKKLRDLEERTQQMKETWKRHEDMVQLTIKSISDRLAIEYVNNVPFKGKPDNVIRISTNTSSSMRRVQPPTTSAISTPGT